ncbi:hypothetical protein Tco_1348797 [Tanacetum coccineum]
MQTNFFKAFVASSTISSIYIQQFWDTIQYDKITGCYKCQLDEQWFNLTKDTLRDALQITPVDSNNVFSSPPTTDALVKFVNDLGYPKETDIQQKDEQSSKTEHGMGVEKPKSNRSKANKSQSQPRQSQQSKPMPEIKNT